MSTPILLQTIVQGEDLASPWPVLLFLLIGGLIASAVVPTKNGQTTK